jgi:hypothetical protein
VAGDYNRKWSDPTSLLINQGPDVGYYLVNRFLERGLPFNEGDVDGAVVDFDNDGCHDLSLSRDSKYESAYTDDEQKAWFGLMDQQPDGSFLSVGVTSGINDPDGDYNQMKGAQNHAWSDIDLDGDLDLLVGGRGGGARVTLECGDYLLGREVKSSRGMHNSMDMRKLLFGLGGFDCEFAVRVDWPDGESHTFAYTDVTLGAYHLITYPDAIAAL